MEENKENATAAPEKKPEQVVEAKVTITVSKEGAEDSVLQARFHTPTLLAEVSKLDDASKVRMTVTDPGAKEDRVLAEGTKAEVVAAIEKSIVPAEHVASELRKFAQFLLDHSNLKAIGCHAVCSMDDGKDGGFGFVATASDCTMAHAVALVNCGDANIDEFISKAKLSVPGRNGTPAKGTVIEPTPEQVEKLG